VKFLIDSADGEQFRFILIGVDGRVVATGPPCSDKGEVLAGIAAMMHAVGDACIEDRTAMSIQMDGREAVPARIGRSGNPPPI
jgi:hypothetical protein